MAIVCIVTIDSMTSLHPMYLLCLFFRESCLGSNARVIIATCSMYRKFAGDTNALGWQRWQYRMVTSYGMSLVTIARRLQVGPTLNLAWTRPTSLIGWLCLRCI